MVSIEFALQFLKLGGRVFVFVEFLAYGRDMLSFILGQIGNPRQCLKSRPANGRAGFLQLAGEQLDAGRFPLFGKTQEYAPRGES